MKLLFFLAFLGAGIGVVGRCACATAKALSFLARRLHPLLRRLSVRLKKAWFGRRSPKSAPITPISEPDWKTLAEEPAIFRKGTMIW